MALWAHQFCVYFFDDLDIQVALGEQLLQPRVLLLKRPHAFDVHRIDSAKMLAVRTPSPR